MKLILQSAVAGDAPRRNSCFPDVFLVPFAVLWLLSFGLVKGQVAGLPVPQINANGSLGQVTIRTNEELVVQVALDAGSYGGVPVDWWVAAVTQAGEVYSLDAPTYSWKKGFFVTCQGPLVNLPVTEALRISDLPCGEYTFYFGVDYPMNGVLDPEALFYTNVSVKVTAALSAFVAVNNTNLVWSPYNWRFNGSSWAQTTPGGGYVKAAFSGSTLGIEVSTNFMTGIELSAIHVHAYIDGASLPIDKTLADGGSDGVIKFASSLSSGNHYAQIYLAKTPCLYDRWTGPAELLRIKSIRLADDGTGNILSLANTPLVRKSRKILIYGDSITEGLGALQAENSYAAVMARQLGMEYGQVGYSYLGWTVQGAGGVPYFHDSAVSANSLWRNFDASGSRLLNNLDLSSGFVDGAPDAVFVNLGINDAISGSGSIVMKTKITAWLSEIRQASGSNTAICVISPFNYGNPGDTNYLFYKAALLGGVVDYQTANPSDRRVYFLDLGASGYGIVLTNSIDGLHPNDAGSGLLGELLATLAAPFIF